MLSRNGLDTKLRILERIESEWGIRDPSQVLFPCLWADIDLLDGLGVGQGG